MYSFPFSTKNLGENTLAIKAEKAINGIQDIGINVPIIVLTKTNKSPKQMRLNKRAFVFTFMILLGLIYEVSWFLCK